MWTLGPAGLRGWEASGPHVRKPHAGALEHRAAFQDLGGAFALQRLARALAPVVAQKARLAVGRLDGLGDARLQAAQVVAHLRVEVSHGMGWI